MSTTHETWIEKHKVSRVEPGTRPSSVLITFDNPAARDQFMRSLCSGRDLVGGGIRHDTQVHCLIHGQDHDGWSEERLAQYE